MESKFKTHPGVIVEHVVGQVPNGENGSQESQPPEDNLGEHLEEANEGKETSLGLERVGPGHVDAPMRIGSREDGNVTHFREALSEALSLNLKEESKINQSITDQ